MSFWTRAINRRNIHSAYVQTFSTPEGKKVLRDLCIEHGVLTNTFSPNAYKHAEAAGERNVVLRIMAILEAQPEDLLNISKRVREDYDE
jgi:hypothetical protein